jgi:hypothetical protein
MAISPPQLLIAGFAAGGVKRRIGASLGRRFNGTR